MPNPLGRDQRLCNLLDLTRTTTQDQNLKAVVMVKVNVNRAHDLIVMPVLHPGQTIVHLPDMVVINQRQRADHLLLRCSNELFNQCISHQVSIRFRAACVALRSYRSIESIEKRRRNRDAQTAQCFLRLLFGYLIRLFCFQGFLAISSTENISVEASLRVSSAFSAWCSIGVSRNRFKKAG